MKFTKFSTFTLVSCTLASTAWAQSTVTLSGTVDLGVQYLSSTANGQTIKRQSMESGNFFPSRLLISAREDLGGGQYAGVVLDNRISADSGAVSATSFFSGNSFTYIGGGWGKFSAGRQQPLSIDKVAVNDPGFANLYGVYNSQFVPLANVRVNNSLKYESPTFAGLNVQAQLGFGNEAVDKKAGRYQALGSSFSAGPFSVHAYGELTNGNNASPTTQSSAEDQRVSLSARYKAPTFDVYVGATKVTGDLQLTPRGTIIWASGSYAVTPQLALYAFGSQYRLPTDDATLFSVGARYALSKRTSVYTLLGQRDNAANTAFGLQYPNAATRIGEKITGLAVGVTHSF